MSTEQGITRIRMIGIAAAVAGAVGALAGFLLAGPASFFQAYLFAYLFWSSLTFGGLAITLLHYLVGGGWGIVIRRPMEAAAKTIWLAALLLVPVILGARLIYPWMDPEIVAADPVLQHKELYLNLPGFAVRAVVYFAVWGLLAWISMRWAAQPGYWFDPLQRRKLQRLSAVGLILFVLTMSLASVDWMMSLQPTWYSTIYGFLIISGQALAGMALGIAVLPLLLPERPLAEFVTPGHIRDLGALLLSLVLFYAYIAFSQYIIIWSANIPHEATWYLARSGIWLVLFLLVVAIQFFLPFLVLLSLRAKRNLRLVAGLSLGILAMHLIDIYWHVTPAFSPGVLPPAGKLLLDLALAAGIGGLWLITFTFHLRRTPLLIFAQTEEQERREHGRKESTI